MKFVKLKLLFFLCLENFKFYCRALPLLMFCIISSLAIVGSQAMPSSHESERLFYEKIENVLDIDENPLCIIKELKEKKVYEVVKTNIFDMSDTNQIFQALVDTAYLEDATNNCRDKFFTTNVGIAIIVIVVLITMSCIIGCIKCFCCM